MTASPGAGRHQVRPRLSMLDLSCERLEPKSSHSPGETELAALLASPPFVGKAEVSRCRGVLERDCDFAVAVPVRDEERRLPATLDAISAAMQAVPFAGYAVFVINDTNDASADVIERWAVRERQSFLALEVSFDRTIRNAPHARRLALDIAARAVSRGALFTTDADTIVGKTWIDTGLRFLAEGYDLVCEDVLLDEQELAALPAQVREVGDAERDYLDLCERLWRYWTYGRAATLGYRPSGASLAMKGPSYLALGGLPTPAVGEDRALCDAMIGAGFAVKAMENYGTRTSARLKGRASKGCGDALADRANSADPECDSRLKPVWLLRDEAAMWMEIDRGTGRNFRALPRREGAMTFSAVRRELAIARKLASAYGLKDV